MADHQKPTAEELKESLEKTIKDIDTPEPEKVEPPEDKPVDEPTNEEVIVPDEPEAEPEGEPEVDETDWKKKYSASAREAQILHARNKQLNEAIEKASALPDPTDEDLIKEYKEWDVMSETERRLARDNYNNKRSFDLLKEVSKVTKEVEAWNEKVDQYVDDPEVLAKKPELEGKVDDFKLFATKPTRRGIDFEILVSSFLWEAEQGKVKNKGKMFQKSAGGGEQKAKKTGMVTLEEAAVIKKNDYNKWKELANTGKIDMTSL